jgi:hypothetical protein
MSIRSALRTYLFADAGIAAIAGPRICPVKLPQGLPRPALIYRRARKEGDHAHYLSGAAGHASALFEITAAADSYSAADALAEAVRQALDGAQNLTVAGTTIRNACLIDEEDGFAEPIDGGDDGVFFTTLIYELLYTETVPSP